MFKKSKNQERVKVDFTKGCAISPKGKQKPLFVDKYGIWFKKGLQKIYLREINCIIL